MGKFAVINFSGNVGKTVVSNHLLKHHLPDTTMIAIETINDDGDGSDEKIKGKDFGALQDTLLIEDDLIVDVGSSNVEEMLRLMAQYKGSHEDIDYYILPVVEDAKQQKDTAATIAELIDMGVDTSKLKIVFNKLETLDDIDKKFSAIINLANKVKIPVIKNGILYNEIYQRLREHNLSFAELTAMEDLRGQIRNAKDANEKRKLADLLGMQRLSASALENLDALFGDLFPDLSGKKAAKPKAS